MTRLSLCLSLAALIALDGLGAGSSARAAAAPSHLGYTVTLPHGWQTHTEVKRYSNGTRTDMMWSHPPDAFPVFRIEVDPQGRATPETAPAMQSLFLGQKMPGFRLLAQRPRRVAGVSGSETAAEGMFKGWHVVLDMIYIIHAGRGYTLTLITPRGEERADGAAFDRILRDPALDALVRKSQRDLWCRPGVACGTLGCTAFLLGDVTGHGLPAATRATEVKDVLRAFLRLYPFYAAPTLTRLNDYLFDAQTLDDRAEDTILGLSLVIVDLKASQAIFAWGGIDPPLILKADGAIEPLAGGGLSLGAMAHATYPEVTVPLQPGDAFLLHTDGLSEARRGKEFLDQTGVIELARTTRDAPTVRGAAQAILDGAREFAGGTLHDDACLILVKRL